MYVSTGLCSWAINIVKFYRVFCDVEPKRKALEAANAELAAAQNKLAKIKAKIKVFLSQALIQKLRGCSTHCSQACRVIDSLRVIVYC